MNKRVLILAPLVVVEQTKREAKKFKINIDYVDADNYEQLENIQTQSDLSELGEQCLDYVLVSGKLFVKNTLIKMESEICLLKEEVETLKTTTIFDKSLVGSGLDLDCLTDACNTTITTYGELFQALITKVCTP